MTEEFEPWQPHAETPFDSNPKGRPRTSSQIAQMHSLRYVHGSLRKIYQDMERNESRVVEFDGSVVGAPSLADSERSYSVNGASVVRADSVAGQGGFQKPSIQRGSVAPDASSVVASERRVSAVGPADNAAPSWEQFALQIQKRNFSEAPAGAGDGYSGEVGRVHGGHNNNTNQPDGINKSSTVPSAPHQLLAYSDPDMHMLQPIRSNPIDPSANDMTCATSSFVSRQFEALSRKDIIIEELDTRHAMVLLFAQATHTMLMRERFIENRKLRERIADLEEMEMENKIAASEGICEIETAARDKLQQLQHETARQIQQEVTRMLTTVEDSSAKGNMKWLMMLEDRQRHELAMEVDRLTSKLMGEHVSQLQRIALEFHLYHARAQNIAAHDTVIDMEEDMISEDGSATIVSRAETEVVAGPRSHAYDPYSPDSIAAGTRKSEAVTNDRYEPASLKALPDSRSYIDDVINRRASEVAKEAAARKAAKAYTAKGEEAKKGSRADEARKEREARVERQRKAKEEAVAKRTAAKATTSKGPSATTPKRTVANPQSASAAEASPATTAADSERSGLQNRPNKPKRPQQICEDAEKDVASNNPLAGVPAFESEDDAEARRRAELARHQLTSLGQFEPCWGWMLKSSGVLMSWQRRFFVMTKSGRIKYTAQDPTKEEHVKWVHVLNAEDITRVESDTFADSTVRPPADQYHNNCFYVDAVRSHRSPTEGGPAKTERFKFCCSNRTEMNKWMWALRNATDVVYTLEEHGLVQRSPLREHFRKMYAILSPLLCSSIQAARLGQKADGEAIELPTYRKRIQMEDDIAALEAQQREALQKERQREEDEQRYYMLSPRNARSPSPPNPSLQ